jgi:molybdenum cofactor guanylyltransferase
MRKGAIILCGGKSSRMGRDKATLPFGHELMLQRVVRLVAEAVPVENIVVVAAADQILPSICNEVRVVRDSVAHQGPLAGMAAGFRACNSSSVDAVFTTGCDTPLLEMRFIDRMFELLDMHDAAIPVDRDHYYALAAVYRLGVVSNIDDCIRRGQRRVRDLLPEIDVRHVSMAELREVDAELRSLVNVNSEDEYRAALALRVS